MINRIAVCFFCIFLGWVLRGVVDTIRRTRRAERDRPLAVQRYLQQLNEQCSLAKKRLEQGVEPK